MNIEARRQFYAEEIEAIANLKTAALVEALATVPRERFLPPGPWTVRGEADFQAPPRQTPDAEPRHVYHNYALAIDATRQLFNGAPGLLAMAIDRLTLRPGHRVLHVGCATGYYTAVMGASIGSPGHVTAIEVDEALAAEARANLTSMPWVEVRCGDGRVVDGRFDAILVNAGVTHPLPVWLDALVEGGRMIVPITAAMTPSIGKGLILLVARGQEPDVLDAHVAGFVAIYTGVGVRDPALEDPIVQALRKNPFPAIKHLRRDAHEPSASCWLHAAGCCLSTD